jgi:hypothetical protein
MSFVFVEHETNDRGKTDENGSKISWEGLNEVATHQ